MKRRTPPHSCSISSGTSKSMSGASNLRASTTGRSALRGVPTRRKRATTAVARARHGGCSARLVVPSDDDLAQSPAVATWELAARVPSTREALAVVAQLAELAPHAVVLTGKELLARRDVPDVVAECARRGLCTTVAVPAPCADPATIARLSAAGTHGVAFEVDAATPAAVAAARDAGLHVELRTTL